MKTVTITHNGWSFELPCVELPKAPKEHVSLFVRDVIYTPPPPPPVSTHAEPRGPGKKRRYRKQPYIVSVPSLEALYQRGYDWRGSQRELRRLTRWCRDNCTDNFVGGVFSFKSLDDAVAFKLFSNGTLTEELLHSASHYKSAFAI